MESKIRDALFRIGITSNYQGYQHIVCAVKIAVENPESLSMITKGLYPRAAEMAGTNWKSVERNIRTVIAKAYERAREEIELMAGYRLDRRPTSAQLLAILVREVSK